MNYRFLAVPALTIAVLLPSACAGPTPTAPATTPPLAAAAQGPSEYRVWWRWATPKPTAKPTPKPTAKPTATPTPRPTATPVPTPRPTTTPMPSSAPATGQAQAVLDLCNVERAKLGLKALVLSSALSTVATRRSQDMVDRNYFAHVDPDGHDPFWHLKQAGISYRSAGENIAYGYRTPQEVMNGWMSSAGHKANILGSSFGKLGVGVAAKSNGTLYWTQLFTD